jgi:hypothetical protein
MSEISDNTSSCRTKKTKKQANKQTQTNKNKQENQKTNQPDICSATKFPFGNFSDHTSKCITRETNTQVKSFAKNFLTVRINGITGGTVKFVIQIS